MFKVGDLVYLKSGSARQTVTEVIEEYGIAAKITVHWIAYETQEVRTLTAPVACFTHAEKPSGPPSRGRPVDEEVPF